MKKYKTEKYKTKKHKTKKYKTEKYKTKKHKTKKYKTKKYKTKKYKTTGGVNRDLIETDLIEEMVDYRSWCDKGKIPKIEDVFTKTSIEVLSLNEKAKAHRLPQLSGLLSYATLYLGTLHLEGSSSYKEKPLHLFPEIDDQEKLGNAYDSIMMYNIHHQIFRHPSKQKIIEAYDFYKKIKYTGEIDEMLDQFRSYRAAPELTLEDKTSNDTAIMEQASQIINKIAATGEVTKDDLIRLNGIYNREKIITFRSTPMRFDMIDDLELMPGKFVFNQADTVIDWIKLSIKECNNNTDKIVPETSETGCYANPVILIGKAYQMLISFHLFNDANKRTARAICEGLCKYFKIYIMVYDNDTSSPFWPTVFGKIGTHLLWGDNIASQDAHIDFAMENIKLNENIKLLFLLNKY